MTVKIYGGPKVSRQFSSCSRQFQFVHGNFNLLTTISVCSRQFQFTHGNFNLLTAVSIYLRQFQFYSRRFQFTHGNFATYSRHFQFFHGNAHGIFRFAHHLSATADDSGLAPKVKTQNQKSIFQVDLQRET